jgi:bifunctional non-homologous end joining protein LigD
MLPPSLKPMLANQADGPFDSDQHLFEVKWDGLRCLAFIDAGRVRLQSRQLTSLSFQVPELGYLDRLPSGTVLDGELVVLESGKPSLRAVQQRAFLQDRQPIQWLSHTRPVTYLVFDLLYLKGKPVMGAPLSFRREQLQQLLGRLPVAGVVATEVVRHHGRQLFAEVMRRGLEGIMAKRLEGPYLPGKRSPHWLKIKPSNRPPESTQLLKWTTTKSKRHAAADWL